MILKHIIRFLVFDRINPEWPNPIAARDRGRGPPVRHFSHVGRLCHHTATQAFMSVRICTYTLLSSHLYCTTECITVRYTDINIKNWCNWQMHTVKKLSSVNSSADKNVNKDMWQSFAPFFMDTLWASVILIHSLPPSLPYSLLESNHSLHFILT